MLTNICNIFTETLDLVFVMSRYDVCNPIHLATEKNDHVFIGWCGKVWEATTMKCVKIEEYTDKKGK